MAFSPEQTEQLKAPLNLSAVKQREQAGRKLSYIEAYHAENEANRIFGFSAWDRFTEVECIGEREVGDKHRVYYRAKVRIVVRSEGEVTIREGCGYGSGIDKDLGQAHESALKEAESDAEKRALKTFGNPFGQALYDKTQADVVDDRKKAEPFDGPAGKSAMLIAAEVAIELCNDRAQLDKWMADNKEALDKASDADYAAIGAIWKARAFAVKPKAVAHG